MGWEPPCLAGRKQGLYRIKRSTLFVGWRLLAVRGTTERTTKGGTMPRKVVRVVRKPTGFHRRKAAEAVGVAEPVEQPVKERAETKTRNKPADRSSSGAPATNAVASKVSATVKARLEAGTGTEPHLVVEARAGSGKTFTLIIGLAAMVGGKVWETCCKTLGFMPEPSPQQAAVWDALRAANKPATVTYLAFNKSIVEAFSAQYGWLVEALRSAGMYLDFATVHSRGFAAVKKAFRGVRVNKFKTLNLLGEVLEVDLRQYTKTRSGMIVVKAVEDLVSKCKLNLIGTVGNDGAMEFDPAAAWWEEALDALCLHYDVECGFQRKKVFELVPQILERSKSADISEVDFDDMVWLPAVLNLPVDRSNLLLGDEAQDWNRAQQAIIRKAGDRLVVCGDPKQAIYGFAGADTESIPRLKRELMMETERGCLVLPLTVTRRCGKAIVAEAKRIVPDFDAHESNGEGEIATVEYKDAKSAMADGDMVLCRVNAPLVSTCFRLLKEGRKAFIKGRNIGEGIIRLIESLKPADVSDLIVKLDEWHGKEAGKLMKRKNPNEDALIALADKRDCVMAFCENAVSLEDVRSKVEEIFSDANKAGVLLSSVHKAKGLEADTVWLLKPELMPHPMAKSDWARDQESNIRYVAITRAIKRLVYVRDEDKDKSGLVEE